MANWHTLECEYDNRLAMGQGDYDEPINGTVTAYCCDCEDTEWVERCEGMPTAERGDDGFPEYGTEWTVLEPRQTCPECGSDRLDNYGDYEETD